MTEGVSLFADELAAVTGDRCDHVCAPYGDDHPKCQRAKDHLGAVLAIDAHLFLDEGTFVLFSEICPQPES